MSFTAAVKQNSLTDLLTNQNPELESTVEIETINYS